MLPAAIYNYFKSGAKTEFPEHMPPHPGGGAQDDRAPPDVDPAVVDKILNVVNAHLDANRNFKNPAVLDEILKLLRNFDPADHIVDKVEKLCSEAETETETESPTVMQGTRLDHAPSDPDPAPLDEIPRLDPAVLDEMLKLGPLIFEQIRNQKAVSFPPGGGGGGAPPHLQDDRAPPDLDPAAVDAIPPNLDPAVVDTILNLVNSHLDANRNFNNPTVLDEIQKLIRNFDPADDIVGKVEKLCLENNKPGEQEQACTDGPSSSTETESPITVQGGRLDEQEQACTDGPSSSTETESPTIVQGTRLDHAPSDVDPATLDQIRRLDPAVLDTVLKLGPLILDQIRNQNAVSFAPGECWTYLRTGTCKNRPSCKFKHPPTSKDKQVSKDKAKEKEELAEKRGRPESKSDSKSEGCKNGKASKSNHSIGQPSVAPEGENFKGLLPVPPVSKDKAKEKEGLAEKPGRPESKNDFKSEGSKNGKASKSNNSRGQPSVTPVGENFMGVPIPPASKGKEKKKEVLAENPGRTEIKNDFKSEGSKNGKASKSNHSRGQPSVAPVGDYSGSPTVVFGNFMGVPIPPVSKDKEKTKEELAEKPGRTESKVSKDKAKEKEAKKPGRTESKNEFRSQGCKNGKAGMSNSSRGRPSGEKFMGVPLQPNGFWSEGRKNAKVRTSNHSRGQPSVAPAGENFLGLPIRPGTKNCPYYMHYGSCKHERSCVYNHPDPEAAGESDPVSTVGLLSAPRSLNRTHVPPVVIPPSQWGTSQNTELNSYQDRNICPHYSRYGICRIGPACTFDHPLHITSSTSSGPFSDSGANWE